jgi:hypothetical protein
MSTPNKKKVSFPSNVGAPLSIPSFFDSLLSSPQFRIDELKLNELVGKWKGMKGSEKEEIARYGTKKLKENVELYVSE